MMSCWKANYKTEHCQIESAKFNNEGSDTGTRIIVGIIVIILYKSLQIRFTSIYFTENFYRLIYVNSFFFSPLISFYFLLI